jgi:hypothetical protein
MRKSAPVTPANYDLVEITNVSQVAPKGCSFAIFYKGMYDLDATVRQMWGDERGVVYWMTHTYKNRKSVCYYIPFPKKEDVK